jgi:hypothetical protein
VYVLRRKGCCLRVTIVREKNCVVEFVKVIARSRGDTARHIQAQVWLRLKATWLAFRCADRSGGVGEKGVRGKLYALGERGTRRGPNALKGHIRVMAQWYGHHEKGI